MLRHSLIMDQVLLPDLAPGWPVPLTLKVGLDEIVLLEGVSWGEMPSFWEAAATLATPREGLVWHWGKRKQELPRPELFRLRRLIAYIAPGQVLFQHLTVAQNLALAVCYYQGVSLSEALAGQEDIVEALKLKPYLSRLPSRLPPELYWRAIWARELAKGPQLVLACLDEPAYSADNGEVIREALIRWLMRHEAAALLAGPDLTPFYRLGHRLLRPAGGAGFEEKLLERSRKTSPVNFFPLV